MNDLSRYKAELNGVLSGFDRLVFRGNLPLHCDAGMKGYIRGLIQKLPHAHRYQITGNGRQPRKPIDVGGEEIGML